MYPLADPFTLVLVSPQIPPNTGNVARLCACTGCKLVLVEPLGFSIDDKQLRRAGLDYWDKVFLRLYPSWEAYVTDTKGARRFLFSALTGQGLWQVRFSPGDHLVFGAETTGLPDRVLASGDGAPVTIPMLDDRRGLNLSTSVGIAAYEALRQNQG
ncbi:MAG: tRNA (cytidine(34)-2'-O)-methyltransferase [Myxococcaceae bacterium]|jgi:tRNA (cytidine/uridine-2'-O-)-methyltransferase|nr:tRNA (cytidine(34)-2'-O)-methyltransferase [Myxococcaceae bacterium]MCA3014700.1 tRNA (cytidine(34)-2'-O)-methyltransferase [Myxococcaceae bacterium]